MKKLEDLKIKIFADGADREDMLLMHKKTYIKGLTTNPTLMKKSGIKDYKFFCKEILAQIKDKPISFEVFSDDFLEMERQAIEIASWGENVFVKIPITNTLKQSSCTVIKKLVEQKVKVNVTAIMSVNQVHDVIKVLNQNIPSYISIFAGRIADTGRDPLPIMIESLKIIKSYNQTELIWASPRELLNIFQADEINCHIITVTNDILKKLTLIGYDLDKYSLDTVKMFYNDAVAAGFKF